MTVVPEQTPIVWEPPPRARRRLSNTAVTGAAVLLLGLAHAAFLVDLHDLAVTPDSCEVYCATVPAVEVPALLGLPVLDLLSVVVAVVLLAARGPRQVLAWVVLAAVPMQAALLVELAVAIRLVT